MPVSIADAIFAIAVACCVVAQVAIVRSTFRAQGATGSDPRVPRPRTAGELFWVVVPGIALALLLGATWRAMHPTPDAGSLPLTTAVAAEVRA